MTTTIDTRAEGLESVKTTAPLLRQRIVLELATRSMTPDECAASMGESILSVRPRFTELKKRGLIRKSGDCRKNASGVRAAVWELT